MKKYMLPVISTLLICSFNAFSLDIGDKAPELKLDKWYNGDAVNPGKPDGKTVYIVEFWATWCPPCRESIPLLVELQNKYKDQNLVLIGISNESRVQVEPFIKQMGMNYLVGLDPQGTTQQTYMKGISGIPHAFIVDKTGLVAWSGNPLSGLDSTIKQVMAGTYSIEVAKKTMKLDAELEQLIRRNDMAGVENTLAKLIEINPTAFNYYDLKFRVLAHQDKNAEIKALLKSMLGIFTKSESDLVQLADLAMVAPSLTHRDPDIAWKAIHKAAELTQYKDGSVLSSLADVCFQVGMLEKAIKFKEKAIAISSASEQAELKASLAYYRSLGALQKTIQADTSAKKDG